MGEQLPLSTLLSQALVAFTIELDNEFELRTPHFTTESMKQGRVGGVWLTSLGVWSHFLRLVPDEGIVLHELAAAAGVPRREHPLLAGMLRWGYVTASPAPGETRAKPRPADLVVRPTANGRQARENWRALGPEIEVRWNDRFGRATIEPLRTALRAVADDIDVGLPRFMPIVDQQMRTPPPAPLPRAPSSELDLPALLSVPLMVVTLEAELTLPVSLPVGANVLRVLAGGPVAVRDLQDRTGTSKESVRWALGVLEKGGHAVTEPDPESARRKRARITDAGERSYALQARVISAAEARFASLRPVLEPIVGDGTWAGSPLTAGLLHPVGTWRAQAKHPPDCLPHHPVVLHRGAYPDGS